MKQTPSTIDALAGAIEMLEHIQKGGSYTIAQYVDRLDGYREALKEERRLDNIEANNRAAIRRVRVSLTAKGAELLAATERAASQEA